MGAIKDEMPEIKLDSTEPNWIELKWSELNLAKLSLSNRPNHASQIRGSVPETHTWAPFQANKSVS